MSKKKQEPISKKSATEVMTELASDDLTNVCHKYFVQIPHKLLRCSNLSHQAKIILFDIIGYMGNNSYAYPPIEDIALNFDMNHSTVRKYINELEDKKILRVERRHNNTYFIYDELRLSGYIIISEVIHAYRRKMKQVKNISERKKNMFLKSIMDSPEYQSALAVVEGNRFNLMKDRDQL